MTLKELQYFREICKDMNFSKAAERLFVTQQCLSKAIAQLERSLDCKLLERDGVVTLTVPGHYFLKQANKILGCVDETERTVHSLCATPPIKVGFINSALTILGLRTLHAFQKTCDTAVFNFEEFDNDQCIDHLASGKVDALITCESTDEKMYIAYPLLSLPLTVMVDCQNPLFEKQSLTLRDLEQQTFITPAFVQQAYRQIYQRIAQHGVKIAGERVVHSAAAAIKLCQSNAGIILIDSPGLASYRFDELKSIPFSTVETQTVMSHQLYFVLKKGSVHEQDLMQFYTFMQQHLPLF